MSDEPQNGHLSNDGGRCAPVVGDSNPREYRPRDSEDGPRCLVVMYHYVHDVAPLPRTGMLNTPPAITGLTTSEFRRQLDQLSTQLEPIDWPTLFAWTCGRGSIPDHCFLLTFDDGLRDHVENVLPILEERRLRGAFFVPGKVLTSQTLLSAHMLHILLATLDDDTLEGAMQDYFTGDDAGHVEAMASVDLSAARQMYGYESASRARLKYGLTMCLPIEVRNRMLEHVFRQFIGSPKRWGEHWYLGWDDLANMQTLGHTIGGHGFRHEPYNRLSPNEIRSDISRTANVLRDGLGADIRPFSYPYGRFDDRVCVACRDVGFAHAFTTQSKWSTHQDDVLSLPRVDTIHVATQLGEDAVCHSK